MTQEQKPRRSFPGVIQSIVDKTGAAGPYFTITFNPRPGLKYPDSFHGRDMALKGNFKAGDNVVLTLEQGKPKHNDPQYEADFWWDVMGIEKAEPEPARVHPKPEAVAPAKQELEKPPQSYWDEKNQQIAAAHLENIRLGSWSNAINYLIARAELTKSPDLLAWENVKKTANDLWLEVMAKI